MVAALKALLNPQCSDISFLDADREIFQSHPIAVFARPWQGRHCVYGIFRLPQEHRIEYPILIIVSGAGRYRKEACMVKQDAEHYAAADGYYLLRVHLKTRVAVSLILRGQSYRLKNPLNWTIFYNVEPVK
ncbi:hypothetical protein XM38_005890 [Halomicronema hongdechloris C2206]|uniref:Uncharacterized protein n=1 Tax=Halomicronema hongdechloris C2206 TaxID=1641165 RepID=A0A1Z3HHA9_9CYAN|nr:hypothetical protein [Halomicronema hongdechloris]ASC69660.1 hypothetical protein XM38_005890 [Halomicronema hongdechloris C2206]